jgi:hypothetical protein
VRAVDPSPRLEREALYRSTKARRARDAFVRVTKTRALQRRDLVILQLTIKETSKMTILNVRIARVCAALFVAAALAGCMSSEEQRLVNLNEDQRQCSGMGAQYGSPAHTQCMLQQQQRRDQKQQSAIEQAYLSSEIARNNQEMLREMRKNDD